jgi:hypothetical protein
MTMQWLRELWVWWDSLPRDMVFFFSLPFIVAAAGLLAHECKQRKHC